MHIGSILNLFDSLWHIQLQFCECFGTHILLSQASDFVLLITAIFSMITFSKTLNMQIFMICLIYILPIIGKKYHIGNGYGGNE